VGHCMRTNQAFGKIRILSYRQSRARGLDWKLQASRYGALLLLILIPVTGVFRIDVSTGFVVMDRQIWFADFFIVFGFWLVVATTMIMMYSTLGTVFCGWACPQNTMSSWANKITRKHLGKRAVIDWNNEQDGNVAAAKNKLVNWLMLSSKLLLASMILALIPMLYFYPAGAVWSFITFQDDARLVGALHWIYTVFTIIVLVNLAVIRHFACRYMCIYRIWQFLFRTCDTLHVTYDASRSDECTKCNLCVTTCSVDIDPRKTSTFDSCINCGECITACDALHEKKSTPGLLRFRFGSRQIKGTAKDSYLPTWRGRLAVVLPVFVIGAGLLTWGLISYDPYHLTVYQGNVPRGQKIVNYHINVSSKMYQPGALHLSVEGLPENSYSLSRSTVNFPTAQRIDVELEVDNTLLAPAALQSFIVSAKSDDGWKDSFRIVYFPE